MNYFAYLWIRLFGTTTWFGLDIGFWVSMGIALLVAVVMNIVFWSMKPYKKQNLNTKKQDQIQS